MLKASVRRFGLNVGLAVCVAGVGSALLSAGASWGQTMPEQEPTQSLALLPLRPMQVEASFQAVQLEAIAQNMNAQMADARSHASQPEGLTLADIPLIGDVIDDVVDEEGNFESGMNLPVDFGVGNVMGSYGVTVSIDWAM
ncbi:MAG: hypothetical protein AAGJ69_05735 [Cyanobacteria bacterium J06559_1]